MSIDFLKNLKKAIRNCRAFTKAVLLTAQKPYGLLNLSSSFRATLCYPHQSIKLQKYRH